MKFLKELIRKIPKGPEDLAKNKWLHWLTPFANKPELWKPQKESSAKGAALGIFIAFTLPLGQIIAAIFLAALLRLNIPFAFLGTFINTPLTYGPVYLFAYQLGSAILDFEKELGLGIWSKSGALALGTLIIACTSALIGYAVVYYLLDKREKRKAASDSLELF